MSEKTRVAQRSEWEAAQKRAMAQLASKAVCKDYDKAAVRMQRLAGIVQEDRMDWCGVGLLSSFTCSLRPVKFLLSPTPPNPVVIREIKFR